MFYESLDQTIKVVLIVLLLIFFLAYHIYQAKKAIENINDERWQLIQFKANRVTMWYFNVLIGTLFIGLFFIPIWGIKLDLDIERVFSYGAYVLSVRYVVEFLALRHYDKVL